jgi:hypothetical protein
LSKDQVEKLFNDFIKERHYIPQKESFTYTAPQPTWLDPYPSPRSTVTYKTSFDRYASPPFWNPK